MFRKVLETIGTRYVIAFLNLALIFINARVLGVQGVGLVGLILAAVNIAVIFNSLFCGNTIVYFMNKYTARLILLMAYLWAPVGAALACLLMAVFGLLPEGYRGDIWGLALLNSFVAANARFLLGKDRIKAFNLTFFLQGGLLFFVLVAFYYGGRWQTVQAYLWGMYLTNGIAFLVSSLLLIPHLAPDKRARGKSFLSIVREMFFYGLWSSADNLAEIYTTRLNYFLVRHFSGLGAVGLLDAGTRVSESVWHISRSVSFITYSEVSRLKEEDVRKQIALRLFKFTFLSLVLITLAIVLIPEWVYTDYLFTAEFVGMHRLICLFAPGIVAFGCNNVIGHYFIGSGKIRFSAFSSFVGLFVLLITGYLLIPAYGVVGSAITSSLAFCSMLFFSIILFVRQTSTRFHDFFPDKADFQFVLQKIKNSSFLRH
ncbi:MAG: polysaccharide biosynthesis C-terminal domain-containing protein [Massilibacteroides sp.]|nr:polysaccharide biosynthesis C-terminal domain-containing protein [Massilibacteroides sp.]MDD3064096.1 polysaccharide biosynthesis C-terminal domain-containing protein [Massilibacteroides sp.]MDD4115628.1 polysaccharide biosynthesis C-terminal domain-containing protein [Massilibacteroides sp.]MDD4659660.1 polysaccharide biosynthesis C-terminal domain-containing protein [Massilibacteroides sp.]